MRLSRLAFALCAVVLAATTVLAQGKPGGGRGGRGGSPMSGMIGNEAVQKELGLEKADADKLVEALNKVSADLRDERPDFQDREGMAAWNKKVTDGQIKVLTGGLKADQMKRFKQIQLQQRLSGGAMALFAGFGGGAPGGPAVFQDPEIEKALSITDDQKSAIKDILADYNKDMGELRGGFKPGGGGDVQEAMKKMQGLQKETMTSVMKKLTAEQKKSLEELKGKEFDVSVLAPRFGARGGKPGKPEEKKKVDF